MMSDVSAGEVGGIVAGGLAALAALGKGGQWLLGWADRRESSRTSKLQAWHDELSKREADFDQAVNARLAKLEVRDQARAAENIALRMALAQVTGALRAVDPANKALLRAEQLLNASFPIERDPLIPLDQMELVAALDAADQANTARDRATKVEVTG